MIKREGTFKSFEYTLERYESVDEFLKELESREVSPQYSHYSTIKMLAGGGNYGSSFYGADNYADAREKFVLGTKAKDEMSKAFKSEVDPRKRETVNAPCGCAPIVPNALMGIPNSMIDIRRTRIPKATKVVVNMSVNGDTSAYSITEAGKKIIAVVGKLEAEGIATEIICTADKVLNHRQISSCGIAIKNAGRAFNAARVSFSMSSPAFLRVFQWLQLGKNPNAVFAEGLGRNVWYDMPEKEVNAYYRAMYGDGIYISLPDVVRNGQYALDNAIRTWKKGR